MTDLERLLQTETNTGGRLWSASDGSIGKSGPFSTLEVGLLLPELGYRRGDCDLVAQVAERIFQSQREDGRFKTFATGAIYPCQTINATLALCALGFSGDPRLDKTYRHLQAIQQADGGWKCNSFKYGHGPETESSNPGPTLWALNLLRFRPESLPKDQGNRAVEFLLWHWEVRKPLGPCHYGMGTQFFKVEYPLLRYNLFSYVYVLSFYQRAITDDRFRQAFNQLAGQVEHGQVRIDHPHRKLKDFDYYTQGLANRQAALRYAEIVERLK